MAVIPDKSHYDVDQDLCYSYPVKISNSGSWEIIKNLEISDFERQKIKLSMKELQNEREMALGA